MTRLRVSVLAAAAALTLFGALGNAFVMVPDLHGDLVEIGVRPSVLGGTMIRLYGDVLATCGFGIIVALSAIQEMRGIGAAAMPLAVIALVQVASGAVAFLAGQNPHHLGAVVSGALIGVALAVPRVPKGR